MSDTRGTNGNAAPESYQPSGGVAQYPSQAYASSNGVNSSGKRGREDDEDPYGRPGSVQGDDMDGLKRRKTMEGGAIAPYNQEPNGLQRRATMTQRRR
jgi:protein SOK2